MKLFCYVFQNLFLFETKRFSCFGIHKYRNITENIKKVNPFKKLVRHLETILSFIDYTFDNQKTKKNLRTLFHYPAKKLILF